MSTTKAFASQADLEEKKVSFTKLSDHAYAYTAEGDPNSGVVIGERFVMVSDATATPAMARDLIEPVRFRDIPVYEGARHTHKDDRGLVMVFRKRPAGSV